MDDGSDSTLGRMAAPRGEGRMYRERERLIYAYAYIYIYRERERERARETYQYLYYERGSYWKRAGVLLHWSLA